MSFPIQPPPPSSIKTTGYLVKVGPDITYPTYEEVRHKLGDMLIRLAYDRYNRPIDYIVVNFMTVDLLNLMYPNAAKYVTHKGDCILNIPFRLESDMTKLPTYQYIIILKEPIK